MCNWESRELENLKSKVLFEVGKFSLYFQIIKNLVRSKIQLSDFPTTLSNKISPGSF